MRLTYVIPFYAPAWGYGGPPRVAHDMARHLAARGHRVDVLTTDAFDDQHRLVLEEVLDGVHIHRRPNLNNGWAWRYKAFLPLGFGRQFNDYARRSDLVHMFDFRTFQNAAALAVLRRSRAAPHFILSAFGELPRARGFKRPIKAVYDVAFGFDLLQRATRVLAQTPEEADEYRRFGCTTEKIRLLPLAVSLDELPSVLPRGTFRARLGLSSAERVVLFLGRIHAYKGIELLIRAAAAVVQTMPDVRLIIAGRDDGYLASAQRLASDLTPEGTILFPGPIYGAERFVAYRDADVFAMTPTHAEQTSLAALEACAVGTPVIVTQQAPIPGLDATGAGVTVSSSVADLTAALVALLDRADRQDMGQRARGLVRTHYSWTSVANNVESIYMEAAGQ